MSADNGYILRRNSKNKYVLQMYFASVDEYPDIDAPGGLEFYNQQDAIDSYCKLDKEYKTEYGLTIETNNPTVSTNSKDTNMTQLKTQTYARNPFNIEAVRVTEENFDLVAKWCDGKRFDLKDGETVTKDSFIKVRVHRPLNERQTQAFVGDWVLYAGTGYKVYTDKAFKASFYKVSEEENPQEVGTVELNQTKAFAPRS